MISRTKVEKVIGKTYADSLDELVFDTGGLSYTRRELVEQVGCASFSAASRLNKVLTKLHVTTAAKLWQLDPASLARVRGIGSACIFTAMCIIEFEGYDCLDWWKYDKDTSVKFNTFKHQVMKRANKRKQEV
jgi:hypothetical protein